MAWWINTKNPMAQCIWPMPGQIKAACVRIPTNSKENWPFICVFNKPLPRWVAVVAHLCWQVCCPFCVSETVINSAVGQAGEVPVPATHQPPVTPNTAKCRAHTPFLHTKQLRRKYSSRIHSHYKHFTLIYVCGGLPVEKKQTKYLQNIFARGSYLHISGCSLSSFHVKAK